MFRPQVYFTALMSRNQISNPTAYCAWTEMESGRLLMRAACYSAHNLARLTMVRTAFSIESSDAYSNLP